MPTERTISVRNVRNPHALCTSLLIAALVYCTRVGRVCLATAVFFITKTLLTNISKILCTNIAASPHKEIRKNSFWAQFFFAKEREEHIRAGDAEMKGEEGC